MHKREQRLIRQSTDSSENKGTIDYHPFQTLFQITCRFIKAHEPLTILASHVNEVEAEEAQNDTPKSKVDVHVVNTQQAPRNPGPNVARDNMQPRNLTCHGCGSTDHFVRNCPNVPKCPHCGQRGHSPNDCWGPSPRRRDQQQGGQQYHQGNQGYTGHNANNQYFNAPNMQQYATQQYYNTNQQQNGYQRPPANNQGSCLLYTSPSPRD